MALPGIPVTAASDTDMECSITDSTQAFNYAVNAYAASKRAHEKSTHLTKHAS